MLFEFVLIMFLATSFVSFLVGYLLLCKIYSSGSSNSSRSASATKGVS